MDASGLKLPETGNYSFYEMFEGATQLSAAPDIKTRVARQYCCGRMFRDCSSLTSTPEISCGTIGGYAFRQAFTNCTSLIQAKDVSCDGGVWGYAFHRAFANCSSLGDAPALPSDIKDSNAYNSTFQNCTSLSTAKVTLSGYTKNACNMMFVGCTNLLSVEIEGPADPTIYNGEEYRCFYNTFQSCSALQYVKIPWTKWDVQDAGNRQFTTGWMYGVHGENGGL